MIRYGRRGYLIFAGLIAVAGIGFAFSSEFRNEDSKFLSILPFIILVSIFAFKGLRSR